MQDPRETMQRVDTLLTFSDKQWIDLLLARSLERWRVSDPRFRGRPRTRKEITSNFKTRKRRFPEIVRAVRSSSTKKEACYKLGVSSANFNHLLKMWLIDWDRERKQIGQTGERYAWPWSELGGTNVD